MDVRFAETENIIFKYFQHVKIHKYFLRPSTSNNNQTNDYWQIDVGRIINNCNLAKYEIDLIYYFGNKLHRPKYRGRYYNVWQNAIEKISTEFLRKGIIK